MKVFKFGGASVKDAEGVKNLKRVLQQQGAENTLIVVSAMGKMTNALESVVAAYFEEAEKVGGLLTGIQADHFEIIDKLFTSEVEVVKNQVLELFQELKGFLNTNKSPNKSFVYDQVVSVGELLSTTIIAAYLNAEGISTQWLDARTAVKTDDYYRGADLDWALTKDRIGTQVNRSAISITQGFIGSDSNNFTTTLGREGSDYTAAIYAYALDAESVTIWKDVPGVLNADPRVFDNTQLLHQISYREAIELAFYGASVIHPKTLQPLQRKEIPLYVKSFLNPENAGTAVAKGQTLVPELPCFILKKEQTLLRLSSLDFSFIVEDNISQIFSLLHQYQMRVELIQNSAISFSVCVQNKYNRLEELVKALESTFKVTVYPNVNLYTIRHFDQAAIDRIRNNGKKILLEQRTQETLQFVTSPTLEA